MAKLTRDKSITSDATAVDSDRKTKRVVITLPNELYNKLLALSNSTGVSIASLVKVATANYYSNDSAVVL